jgi:DNA-binding FadR family transcriptional regulator
MSSESKPEKPREDDFRETPEWHRPRAQGSRKNGFTKMAEEHEQIVQAIERGRQQQTK